MMDTLNQPISPETRDLMLAMAKARRAYVEHRLCELRKQATERGYIEGETIVRDAIIADGMVGVYAGIVQDDSRCNKFPIFHYIISNNGKSCVTVSITKADLPHEDAYRTPVNVKPWVENG